MAPNPSMSVKKDGVEIPIGTPFDTKVGYTALRYNEVISYPPQISKQQVGLITFLSFYRSSLYMTQHR